MIKSMTGFGRGELNTEIGHLTVEVRSVNSRSCNVTVKLPDVLSSLESHISNYIRDRTSRGQISVSVALSRDGAPSGRKVVLDRELAAEYCKRLTEVKEYLSLTDYVSLDTIASLPGVIDLEESVGSEDIERIWAIVRQVLSLAVDQFMETRRAEGAAIQEDISRRLETIRQLTERISVRAPAVVEEYHQRLCKRINELLRDQIEIDESRIVMEAAIMAERCDITEEVVRLRSHIDQIEDGLKRSEGPVGRRLDFILQEMNREVNTIASKASDVQISMDCIQFKDEIEKMREQVQNVE